MDYSIDQGIETLERTPDTLIKLLSNLSDAWIYSNKGEHTWSPFDILGHLIHGEKTDWISRVEIVLNR